MLRRALKYQLMSYCVINIIVYQHQILVELTNDKIELPKSESLEQLLVHLIPLHTSNSHYVATVGNDFTLSQHSDKVIFLGLRQALQHFNLELIKEIVYYQQLNDYFLTHRFCGKCGNQTIRRNLNKFVYCPNCEHENYPHIAPCTIVRIHRDDTILMARGINFPPNAWGLVAGFIEIGESLEEGAKREVKEEVGIEIDNLKYWGSQPWPFPSNSLMIGFTADYKSGEIVLQEDEIEAAGFYTADKLPGRPSTTFSIANRMIQEFVSS